MSGRPGTLRRRTWLVLAGAAGLCAAGCYGPYRPRSLQRIIGSGLAAEYDSHRDRLVRFGPRGRFNLLRVPDEDAGVGEDGSYGHFGGMYSWIAPQSAWTDEQGRFQPWPPPAAMDVGPTRATRHGLNEFEAFGPVLRSGLQETKSVQLGRDHYGPRALVTHGLHNAGDQTARGGVWLSTGVIPGSVIAVFTPEEGREIEFSTHPNAREVWDNVTRSRGRWTLVRTKRYYEWLGMGGTFKARIPSDRVIAMHRRGHWFVRIGDPWSPETESLLTERGHAPVEVAVNFGRRIHEAALLGPIETIAPGETNEYRERWYVIPGMASRVRQLDRVLHSIDPARFPLPHYLADEQDDPELEHWLNEESETGPPAEEAPRGRDAHDEPPIDIDDVSDR